MAQKQSSKKKRTQQEPERVRPDAAGPIPNRSDSGQRGRLPRGIGGVRSRTWKVVLAALVVVVAGITGLGLARSRGRRTPIVLISIDTLRADHLPVYGYGKIQTPVIDELARLGTVFENCYTHVPLTLPAHSSMFTGLLPPAHGVRNNIGFRLGPGARTLAAELKQAGYSTGGAVSAYVLHSSTGISQGFDWYDDDMKAGGPEVPLTEIQRDGTETVNRALSWLTEQSKGAASQAQKKGPIFLFVHLYEPHTPYSPPQRFLRPGTAPYDGEVMYSDEIVGSLLAGLRRLDLYDSSLILLVSDHGEALGDHGEADHGVFLYREVMHVPLIVKVPGAHGGGRIQAPVQLIDIAPTILDWAGLSPAPELRGKSLRSALLGHELPSDRLIYAESFYGRLHFGWKELFSLTSSQYNFILAPRQELYDIRLDPAEANNLLTRGASGPSADGGLSKSVGSEYKRMHEELTGLVGRGELEAPKPVDEEALNKLRALGYIGASTLTTEKDEAAPDPKDRIGDLALFRQAMRLKKVCMFSKVAEALRTALETSPRMIDAWDELSEVYQRLGSFDKAVDALKQSLQVAPHRAQQRLELVDILIQLRRFDEARDELRVASSEEPDEAEVQRAVLEVAAGRAEAAREAATRAARGLPAAVPFVEGVLAYDSQEYSKALPFFQRALGGVQGRSARTLPHIHFYLGDVLAREGRRSEDEAKRAGFLQEAERQLLTELALHPTSAVAAASLGFVHALGGDVQKVDSDLNGFARQNPSVATYELIATLYENMRLSDRAVLWHERARQLQANHGLPQ